MAFFCGSFPVVAAAHTLLLATAFGLSACTSLPRIPELPALPRLPDIPHLHGLNSSHGERIAWSCASGSRFSIRSNQETRKAEVFAGGRIYRLDQTDSGFGDESVNYMERGGFASLAGASGGPYDLCRRV